MVTGRFELVQQVGAGGMGAVWKARDHESGATVALKFIHPLMADDPEYVRRFENEVDAPRRFNSPNVAQGLGYGRRDGLPYLVMEYVDGTSLAQLLESGRRFSWDEARAIGSAIARGLQAAHKAGVIHRDIKPSNVLFSRDGTVKLVDFGVARTEGLTQHTQGPIGTLAYMAPDTTPSPRMDLYSLGCVLFELMTGTPPFVATSVTAMLKAHAFQRPPLEKLPREARQVVKALLEKQPARRPASASVVVAALESGRPLASPEALATQTVIRIVTGGGHWSQLWPRLVGTEIFVMVLYLRAS